ncbi:MAG: radical SAM family heme chaperone HemW [Bacillota bacterium]
MWAKQIMNQPLGIYVHIPFCVKKCGYCDFPSIENGAEYFARYTAAVCAEIAATKYAGRVVDTLFFGGGTPSLLPADCLAAIMNKINQQFCLSVNCEISLEANPGTITEAKVAAWRRAGFNRVSVGVQSFDDDLLRGCGRIHSGAEARVALAMLRAGGFVNINVDLISGLPGQTLELLQNSVAIAIALGATHISLYTLKIETGTKFAAAVEHGELLLPDDEQEDEMYDAAVAQLAGCDFVRYEISNYALPGYQCRHNLKYWQYKPYLGFGSAAAMFCDGKRATNINSVCEYIEAIEKNTAMVGEQCTLEKADAMAEYAFLGLRTTAGVALVDFCKIFAENFEAVFAEPLAGCYEKDWLQKSDGSIFLTKRGLKLANRVFAEFI